MTHIDELLTLTVAALVLTGCGQVITRATPTPPHTPTVAAAPVATLRPTSTPAPYTPAPTATPTLTPTPIIYVIRKGDTPLGIAQHFGVSLRDLQETNGITDPRTLRVGQELIIPIEAGPGEETPTLVPTPLPFSIENLNFGQTAIGQLWSLGEIHNTTGTDLEQAVVSVALLDDKGNTLAQEQAPVQVEYVPSGERAPFAVQFQNPPRGFASYLVVPVAGITGYPGSYYKDLAVQNGRGEGEHYSTYTVSGDIVNLGPEDAVDVMVTVTIYDAIGRVIGTRRGPPEHNVVPQGGRTTFRLLLTPIGGPVASFRTSVLGRRLPTPTPSSG